MNYMPEIAKMLGLEIGEEFMIRNPVIDFIFDNLRYKITERGLLERNINDSKCYESFLLIAILYGKNEVVKLPKSKRI